MISQSVKGVLTADASILWPLPLDSCKTGVITHVLTNRRPSRFDLCDSPFAQLTCSYGDNDNRSTESISVHCGEIDCCNQYQPVKPLALPLLLQRRRHQECFALSCDLSIFRQELGMGSICYRQLIFHWWPSRDERAEGEKGEKGEGEDGMMTWLCKALRGQSREQVAWSRNR